MPATEDRNIDTAKVRRRHWLHSFMFFFREVFIDEDRDKLKNDIEFLGSKIKDAEKQGEEAMKNDALKEEKIGDLENKIRDLELELERNKESLKEIDDLKKENAILISAKKADDEKMEWLANERDHDRENFDAFTKKVSIYLKDMKQFNCIGS